MGITITDISFPWLLVGKGKSRECSVTVNQPSPAPAKWSPLRAELCGWISRSLLELPGKNNGVQKMAEAPREGDQR